MKQPLPVCVRFHKAPNGQKLPLLTCSETGRPIDFQTDLEFSYGAESGGFEVKTILFMPPEEVVIGEREPAVGFQAVYDEDDEDDEEDYGRTVGFRNAS